jgi:methyltransferase (TIGR00027 family)
MQTENAGQSEQPDQSAAPDSTAVRVALWRAMHVQVDAPPHVLEDEIGLRLADPDEGWRGRRDMDPDGTRRFRATLVARTRFIEDLVTQQAGRGVDQYVVLGAGLDTFAQRRPPGAAGLRVFEVDRPEPQEWKRRRLVELGYDIPQQWLRFVPVDFEAGGSWWDRLADAGFDAGRPAVVASTGVTMYLTRAAIEATLRQVAVLAPGSTLAMTFMLPLDLIAPDERSLHELTRNAARASGTPFISFFTPPEMLELARAAGFKDARHVSGTDFTELYFAGRPDGLRALSGEDILIATT